jgi:hypothetical protein
MERVARTRQLGAQASVAYDPVGKCIRIALPAEQARQHVSGRIQLYRPSQAGLDRQVKLNLDPKGSQQLDAAGLVPGLWKVRVSWTVQGQDYFIDQVVVVGTDPNSATKSRSAQRDQAATKVAQVANLLYRRLPVGGLLDDPAVENRRGRRGFGPMPVWGSCNLSPRWTT